MTRRLTVLDRAPRPGDVLQRYQNGRRIEVRSVSPSLGFALVWDGRGLFRIGLYAMQGGPVEGRHITKWQDGRLWYSGDAGWSWSSAEPPYAYVSRADGARVDWPIDAGGYC